MPPVTKRYVSNQGPDKPGDPEDVRFVGSTATYEDALALKAKLDPLEEGRAAVIFRSIVRLPLAALRPSHETWHLDGDTADSVEATGFGVEAIGYDVFVAPLLLIDDAKKSWSASALCNNITGLLRAFSQTGDPSGAK